MESDVFILSTFVLQRGVIFELGLNNKHDYKKVYTYDLEHWDGDSVEDFPKSSDDCEIHIGSDVWIGANSTFKVSNSKRPLIIGDGAVIASDSVVVKNVPPYAIVGGNPAQVIKYRFSPEVIEKMLAIKWWDWDLEKIGANFSYFSDPLDFVKRFG